MDKKRIPAFVSRVIETIQKAGHDAYLVGGCVRDLLRIENGDSGSIPKDWDITTDARPAQTLDIFSSYKTVNENNFGTVTVINIPKLEKDRNVADPVGVSQQEQVEVTTYRSEGQYTDFRRPDSVSYETTLEKDLERRDFTMNAIAWDPVKDKIVDPFNGLKDIKDKIIRTVLYADQRFAEDALRMMRAVRFSVVLGFVVESHSWEAIQKNSALISNISPERIRDEFLKIINSDTPALGITLLERSDLLKYIIPELYDGIGCEQKGAHIFDVYNHLLHALQHAADKKYDLEIRLAALLHDIGKPATRRYDKNRDKYTFYGHEVVGARMAKKILERLRVPRETIDNVVSLVRNHMFFSDTDEITLSAVRRIIQKVGVSNIWQLMRVRECDRVGMKKAEAPYRLRKYHAMIEEALHDPISVSQLAIDGSYLMEVLHMKPGPKMGWILHALLEEVLDDPTLNTKGILHDRAYFLGQMDDEELRVLGEKGKEKKETVEKGEIEELKKKHRVN